MVKPVKISRNYTYDAENQLTSVTYENGVEVSYTYDKAGNRISVTSTVMSVPPVTGAGPAEPESKKTTSPRVPAAQHVCGNCGAPVAAGRQFCSGCGAPVSSTVPTATGSPAASLTPSVCPGCGSPVKSGIKFCGDCGRHL